MTASLAVGLYQFQPALEYDTTSNLCHEHLLAEPPGIFERVKATGGCIRPPHGPGMGIAFNEDFIKHTASSEAAAEN